MSKFHLEESERRMDSTKACKLIMPDVLAREREVARNKFYEYQFMSPLAATQHFAELYSQKAKAFARMNQDIETAEKVLGMGHNLFSKPSASLTEFWNTRLKADRMGMPYGLLIEFGFHFAGRRKWRAAPRPGQLFGSKGSDYFWFDMFETYAEEHFHLFTRELDDLPQYRSENYRGLQSQDDYREFIRETITRPGQQWDRKIMQNCIERRYLPLSQTLYMVPKDLRKTTIESVRSDMGLIFLRHAYSRFLKVRDEIIPTLPSRGGVVRELTKEDFSRRGSIYLRPEAQFDTLVGLPEGESAAAALITAMESIEADYETLKGLLPKQEYAELDDDVLRQVLRIFNDPALQKADGDVFGRIYEYFLTQFADQKAHDNGEFFTPVSIVETIVNVIEPTRGKVIDPACGSGGMFVQSAHFVEAMKANPNERLTFYGMEKNPTTIRLAKMNLAVHGLDGDIEKAISYYEDPHQDQGPFDYVMANPPFNVDEIDAEKIKDDKRLSFGLPDRLRRAVIVYTLSG